MTAPEALGVSPAGDGSWEWLSPQPQGAALSDVSFGDAQHAVAAGMGTVLRTSDGGETWTASLPRDASGLIAGCAQFDLTSVAMVDASVGWVSGTDLYSGHPLVLRTADGGSTWSFDDAAVVSGPLESVAAAGRDLAWAVGRDGDKGVILCTRDGGATWSVCWSSPRAADLHDVTCIDGLRVCAVGVERGTDGRKRALVVVTDNGGVTWTTRSAGPRSGFELNAVCAAGDRGYRAAGGSVSTLVYSAVLASDDDGATWRTLTKPYGLGFDSVSDITFAGDGFGVVSGSGASDYQGLSVTRDGGRKWSSVDSPVAGSRGPAVTAVSPTRLFAVGGGGQIAASADAGATWRYVAAPAGPGAILGETFAGPDDIWMAGSVTNVLGPPQTLLLRSTDRGRTWSNVDVGVADARLHDVAFEGRDGLVIGTLGGWVSYDPVALRTSDGGATWTSVSLPAPPAYAPALQFDGERAWYIGFGSDEFNDRILRSSDGGTTWEQWVSPTPDLHFSGLAFVDDERGWAAGSRDAEDYEPLDSRPAAWATDDGGATWVERSVPGVPGDLEGIAARDDEVVTWGVRYQQGDERWPIDLPLLLRSDDGGREWRQIPAPVATGSLWSACLVGERSIWVAGSSPSLSRGLGHSWGSYTAVSDDAGATWHLLEIGDEYLQDVQEAPDGTVVAIDNAMAVLQSATGGMPLVDVRGPESTVAVLSKWANKTFRGTVVAADYGRAGVAGTAWRVDDGSWTEDADIVLEVQGGHEGDGVHRVEYRSWDNAGNQEPVRSFTLTVDTRAPQAVARPGEVRGGRRPVLVYRVADELSPTSTVRLTVQDWKGRVVRRRVQEDVPVGATRKWTCSVLPSGRYTWSVEATDLAGNPQEVPASARLLVR